MARVWTPYEEAEQQGRLWTPIECVENHAAWFDTSDPSRCTFASGTYSAIDDVFLRGPDMQQGSASLAPAISSINGRLAANFDKTNGVMLEYYAATATMANSFTMVIACAVNAVGTNARPITFIRSAGGNDYDNTASIVLMSRSATNTIETYFNNAQRCTTTIVDGALMIFAVSSDGTNVYHHLNGRPGGSGLVPSINLSTGQFGVGCYSSAPSVTNYQGLWGEMVAVRAYSEDLRQRLEGALAWKWGLEGKFTDHPYMNAPPLLGT